MYALARDLFSVSFPVGRAPHKLSGLPSAIAGLVDDNPQMRVQCARLLGRAAKEEIPAAVHYLTQAVLEDTVVDVRVAAATALGNFGCVEAITPLTIVLTPRLSPHMSDTVMQALFDIAHATSARAPARYFLNRSEYAHSLSTQHQTWDCWQAFPALPVPPSGAEPRTELSSLQSMPRATPQTSLGMPGAMPSTSSAARTPSLVSVRLWWRALLKHILVNCAQLPLVRHLL